MRRTVRFPMLLVAAAALAAVGLLAAEPAQTFQIDPANSSVGFSVRHLISRVQGQFNQFSGSIQADPKDPAASLVQFTIQAGSIDTHVEMRDKDLRSANFFDADKYPTITFVSTKIVPKGKDLYDVHGKLTMHGVTREVVLPVSFTGKVKDPWGNERIGFSLHTSLDRKDYGITWNKVLDDGGLLLGDDVEITIHIEGVRKLEAPPKKAAKAGKAG